MPFIDIPNDELEDGDISAQEHLRTIRDNVTEFRKGEDHIVSAPPIVDSLWNLERSPQVTEEIGRGPRRYGLFGPRPAIFGTVTRYVWRALYTATARATITLVPPEENMLLLTYETVGPPFRRVEDRNGWVLGDYDVSIIGNTIHIFYETRIEGDQEFNGEGRRVGPNLPAILPDNLPEGGRNQIPNPPEEPPSYNFEFRPIWIRGGGLTT